MVFMPSGNSYIVVVGNIMEGWEFIGPFNTAREAEKYGETEFGKEAYDWSCIELVEVRN